MTLNNFQRSDLIKALEAKKDVEDAQSRLADVIADLSFDVAIEYQRLTGVTVKNHETCKHGDKDGEEEPCESCQYFEKWEPRQ